uniref:Uncharacterized protein n=1 Tax=Zonotrichia albicollis TaxID=44394 RepID=A0A8D2MM76_ZONAL
MYKITTCVQLFSHEIQLETMAFGELVQDCISPFLLGSSLLTVSISCWSCTVFQRQSPMHSSFSHEMNSPLCYEHENSFQGWELADSSSSAAIACIHAQTLSKCKVPHSSEEVHFACTTVRTCTHIITATAL